mmetsp:Transcript_9191/g.34569  ORF Transcript_9191/g.34569 Transcript_9191/m.34569 type:complete len:220 (-) Transcript_9191:3643-4302(-)
MQASSTSGGSSAASPPLTQLSWLRCAASAPQKASPAPTVFTTLSTLGAVTRSFISRLLDVTKAPRLPSVTSTVLQPMSSSLAAAASTSSMVSTGRPVSSASSVSLGHTMLQKGMSSTMRCCISGVAGAGLRIVTSPFWCASRSAANVASSGTSPWQINTFAAEIWPLESAISAAESSALAPGTTTTQFSPLSSTRIGAVPVEASSVRSTQLVSTSKRCR